VNLVIARVDDVGEAIAVDVRQEDARRIERKRKAWRGGHGARRREAAAAAGRPVLEAPGREQNDVGKAVAVHVGEPDARVAGRQVGRRQGRISPGDQPRRIPPLRAAVVEDLQARAAGAHGIGEPVSVDVHQQHAAGLEIELRPADIGVEPFESSPALVAEIAAQRAAAAHQHVGAAIAGAARRTICS
jgi:hypothetical protein